MAPSFWCTWSLKVSREPRVPKSHSIQARSLNHVRIRRFSGAFLNSALRVIQVGTLGGEESVI